MSAPNDAWFSNESFWIAAYDAMFPQDRFDAADGELEASIDLVGERPQRVLDLACGPGRHAVAAARSGMAVVGVDRSAFLLQKARDLAVREGVDVEWWIAERER